MMLANIKIEGKSKRMASEHHHGFNGCAIEAVTGHQVALLA